MSLAEELAAKFHPTFVAPACIEFAVDEALERAAQECREVYETYPSTGAETEESEAQVCERRVRALKSKP